MLCFFFVIPFFLSQTQGQIRYYIEKANEDSNKSLLMNVLRNKEKSFIVSPKLSEDEEPFEVIRRTHIASSMKVNEKLEDEIVPERKNVSLSEVASFCKQDFPISFLLSNFAKISNKDAVNDDPAILLIDEYLYFLNPKNMLQVFKLGQKPEDKDYEYDAIQLISELKVEAPQFVFFSRFFHSKESSQLILMINGKNIYIYDIREPSKPKFESTIMSDPLSIVLNQESNRSIAEAKIVMGKKCFFIIENPEIIQVYCIDKDNILINTKTLTKEDFNSVTRNDSVPLNIQDIWVDEDNFLVLDEIGGLYFHKINNEKGLLKLVSVASFPHGKTVRLFGNTLLLIVKKYNINSFLGVFYEEYSVVETEKLTLKLIRSFRAQMDNRFDLFLTKDFSILPQVNFVKLTRHSILETVLPTENSVYKLNTISNEGIARVLPATNNPSKNIFFLIINGTIILYDTRMNNFTLTCSAPTDYQIGGYVFRQYFLTKTCSMKRKANDTSINSYCAFLVIEI